MRKSPLVRKKSDFKFSKAPDRYKVWEFTKNLSDQQYDQYLAVYFETEKGKKIEQEYIRIVQDSKIGLLCAMLDLFVRRGYSLNDVEKILKDIKAGRVEEL